MTDATGVKKKNTALSGAWFLTKLGLKFIHVFGAIIVFVLLWQWASTHGWVNGIIIPPPTVIASKGWELTLSGELFKHIQISLYRVFFGFGAALVVGLLLGFLLGGWFKLIERAVNPLLQVFSQANPFTLFPVFIVLLGLTEISKIAVIFVVCIWPILFNTITGIKNVDPTLVKLSRSLGLTKFQIFYKVLLRGSLPSVFTGIRMSSVFAFFMLIGAEMLGASSGLGYMIHQAQATIQYPKVWVGIVTVALLGIIVNLALTYLEKKITGRREEIVI
ncbi:MAG: ABC transporter permease [Candidatus Methanoplasma sp.]|jgi:NitT/TauT family transport system permease protein|nr:ABC transporter permease [Candidatus Methanoplasma sp.]